MNEKELNAILVGQLLTIAIFAVIIGAIVWLI